MSLKSTIAAIAASTLAAAAIIVTPTLASAAPGDVGSPEWASIHGDDIYQWAVVDDEATDNAEWLSGFGGTQCISPSTSNIISGIDEHPTTGDQETRPVIALTQSQSQADYAASNGTYSLTLDPACVSAWDLTGEWFMADAGSAIQVAGGGYEAIQTDDVLTGTGPVVTTADWLSAPSGALGEFRTSWLYFERNDGDYVWAYATFQLQTAPTISPTPATLAASVDEPLTIDLVAVLGEFTLGGDTIQSFPCTMSDDTPCTPDGVTFGSLPDGATGDVNGPISWTPTAPGSYPFTYALSDSTTGAVSDFVTGTIEVTEDAADAVLNDHAWSVVLGQTLTLDAADFAEGCEYHDAFTGESVGVSCAAAVVGSLEAVTSPDGASITTFIDGGGEARFESLSFIPASVGTFEVTYRAAYAKGWTNIGTGIITVTAAPVPPVDAPKPIVTG